MGLDEVECHAFGIEKATPMQNGSAAPSPSASASSSDDKVDIEKEGAIQEIANSTSVFTWESVEYTVPYLGGQRKLLVVFNRAVCPDGFSLDLTKPTANLPAVIFQYALSAYPDWNRLAWAGALLIAAAVLSVTIVARALTKEQRRS